MSKKNLASRTQLASRMRYECDGHSGDIAYAMAEALYDAADKLADDSAHFATFASLMIAVSRTTQSVVIQTQERLRWRT